MSTRRRPDQIAFRPGDLSGPLADRVSEYCPSEHRVAQRDLERYYTMLVNGRSRIPLTREELSLVLDALNGIHLHQEAWAPLSIPLEIHNYVRIARERSTGLPDALTFGEGADADALVAKIARLGVGELYALADLAERFWALDLTLDEVAREIGA